MLSVGAGNEGMQFTPDVHVVSLVARLSLMLSTTETVLSPESKTMVVEFAPGIISDGALPPSETVVAVSWSFLASAISNLLMLEF